MVARQGPFGAGNWCAMDSHVVPDVAFNDGISLEVLAPDQYPRRVVEALSAGGAPGVCGWLTDRYGLSWQRARPLQVWLTDPDPAARDRASSGR